MTDFTKKVSDRVKGFPCSQNNCRSNGQDKLEIIIFGTQDKAPKRGFMCSSCFLDDQAMIRQFKEGKITAIPIGMFMKNLNEFYEKYRDSKESQLYQPQINQKKMKQIRELLSIIDNEISKKINQVLSGVYKQVDVTINELRTNNRDQDFEKLIEFLKAQKHIDISEALTNLSDRIIKLQDRYSFSRQQQVRQGNDRIIDKISKIIKLAQNTILKLIELQKKQIQFILS